MSSLPWVRRRRTMGMAVASIVVLVGVGGLLYTGAKALVRYQGAKNAAVTTVPIPVTPVGMLATVDEGNHLTSIAMFVWKPESELGGSIVAVPVSSDTAAGVDEQRIPLTQVYDEGGAEALVLGVESVLSVTIDQYLVATPEQAAAVLRPVEPIDVNLPTRVVASNADGTSTPLFEAGSVALTGSQAASILTAKAPGQTEAQRRPVLEAVWAGVATAVGQGRMTAPTSLVPSTFDDVVARVYAGPVAARGLPAGPVPADEAVQDKDVEVLDRPEAVLVFASIAPASMSASAVGLNFEVQAPAGFEAKVKSFVAALLYLGANVQRVYLNGPSQATTIMMLADPRFRDLTAGAEGLVGSVEVRDPDVRLEGIDVTFKLGSDYLTNATPDTLPSTTAPVTVP
jgi:hypothetical protein